MANENRRYVNDQITDAVTQANVKVVSETPAMALPNVYQSAVQAQAMSMTPEQMAAFTQQQNPFTIPSTLDAMTNAAYAVPGIPLSPEMRALLGLEALPDDKE